MNSIADLPEMLDAKLLLAALTALKKGDFSVRMPSDLTGLNGKIADTLNRNTSRNSSPTCRMNCARR